MSINELAEYLVGALEDAVGLEGRDDAGDDKVGVDAVGGVDHGAGAEDGRQHTGNGLLDGILEDRGVLGPVVVEESCNVLAHTRAGGGAELAADEQESAALVPANSGTGLLGRRKSLDGGMRLPSAAVDLDMVSFLMGLGAGNGRV